jgi:hypothetical protein
MFFCLPALIIHLRKQVQKKCQPLRLQSGDDDIKEVVSMVVVACDVEERDKGEVGWWGERASAVT